MPALTQSMLYTGKNASVPTVDKEEQMTTKQAGYGMQVGQI